MVNILSRISIDSRLSSLGTQLAPRPLSTLPITNSLFMANFCKAIRNSTLHLFLLMDSFSIDDDCISYYFQGGSGKEEGFIVQFILIIYGVLR